MGWSRPLDGNVPLADCSRCASTSASHVSNGLAHSRITGHGSHTGPGPLVLAVTGQHTLCGTRFLTILNYINIVGFGPKRDEVKGEWRKLHNEELHDLYSSPSIIRIIKSRRMRWAGHIA
jgi:hypothetical protein